MDSETQSKADAAAVALERDVQYLEHEAARAGKSLALKLGPPVAGLVVLMIVAWILGRKTRRNS